MGGCEEGEGVRVRRVRDDEADRPVALLCVRVMSEVCGHLTVTQKRPSSFYSHAQNALRLFFQHILGVILPVYKETVEKWWRHKSSMEEA